MFLLSIGAKYLHDCPVERMIPIYLIVVGVVTIFSFLIEGLDHNTNKKDKNQVKINKEDRKKRNKKRHLTFFVNGFLITWFIRGRFVLFI